jgi:cytochrome c-type biogenesis protein CcmF
MVQERRGMLRVWNVSLVIVTFFLTIVGTFLTRSGVVQSVHAFGDDPALARLFTAFMITILAVSFGFVIYRLPLLRARNELDSWVSREAAFLVNNWILLVAPLFILFATMFPTLTQAVTGERITVGPPFYNKWMMPIGLTLLVLTGIGPLLAWRKSTLVNLRNQFLGPVLTGLVVGGAVVALGVRIWSAGLCFAFCGFVTGTIVQEFWRGAKVRKGATGTDIFTALVGLVARNRRRYGGYIVHVGIVFIFLGFAGNGFNHEETALLKAGQQMKVADYSVRFDGLKVTDDGQKQMITGTVVAMQNGKEIARMYPARWYFRKHESEPTSEVAIRRGFGEDVYVILAAYSAQDNSASIKVVINPLVNWVWFGFGVLAVGTAIAFLPESAFAFATAQVPANAVTTGMLLLALVLWPAVARAQQGSGHMVYGNEFAPSESRSPVEKAVGRKLICMCGDAGCGKQLAGECACGFAAQMRTEIAQMAHEGKTEDQIVGFYLAKYGSSEVLAEPPNRGFDRLSWLFPYAVGIGGLVTIFFVTRRWSHPTAAPAGPQAPVDADLDARVDDELRKLD